MKDSRGPTMNLRPRHVAAVISHCGCSLRIESAMRCLEQDHREAIISDRLVSNVRVSGSPVIPFAMAYDRVHECLTSVLCWFLIYEVLFHAADTPSLKLERASNSILGSAARKSHGAVDFSKAPK